MGRVLKPDTSKLNQGGNPLTATDFKIIVRKKNKVEYNADGGKVSKEIDLEYERYVKVFVDSDKRKVMASLRSPAKGLFLWLLYELESGCDYVWVNKKRYMDEENVKSINTVKAGIEELVYNKLIAVSLIKDVYWINPRFIFCGSRINKYPENVVEYKAVKDFS